MDYNNKNIQGTFFTSDPNGVISGFFILQNSYWVSTTTYNSYLNLYLDRNKKILIPKNDSDKQYLSEFVLKLISHYEKIIEEYETSGNFKKVSPSFSMGKAIANSYMAEYRKIYMNYFASNSLKYIFEDWLEEE
jgi:hypothetical protein